MAVPALPRNRSAPSAGNRPAQPCTTAVPAAQSASTCTPSASRAPTMYRMSSLSCTNGVCEDTHGWQPQHLPTCMQSAWRSAALGMLDQRQAGWDAHQQVLHIRGALCECGQQQDAVGQALGSRQLDGALYELHRRNLQGLHLLCTVNRNIVVSRESAIA